MSYRGSARITGGQIVVVGTATALSVDWRETDNQSFTISSATVTLYDRDGVAASAGLTGLVASIGSGEFNGEARTSVSLSAAETGALAAGVYYALWTLILSDSQTRIVRQRVAMRNP